MNITLTIQAPELVGAIENLASALGTSNPLANVQIDGKEVAAKVENKKSPKPPTQKAKPKAEEPSVDEPPFAPVEEPPAEEEVPEVPEAPEEPVTSISLDVVTTKTREYIQSNPANRAQLKGFLDSRGAKKVTDLPPSDYQALLHYMEGSSE